MLDCRKDFEEKFVNFSTIAIGATLLPFLNLVNGADRITEDKISAAMLRKFGKHRLRYHERRENPQQLPGILTMNV